MKKFILNTLTTRYNGFQELLRLKEALESAREESEIFLDMSYLTRFDGSMCACLGGLLKYYRSKGLCISTKLSDIEPKVRSYLSQNEFLSLFGQHKIMDYSKNNEKAIIDFKSHKINNSNEFQAYIGNYFSLYNKNLPNIPRRLLKHFRTSLYEIYLNAVEHAETQLDIFTSGEFFAAKQQLDFCVTDLGIGIKENIRKKIHLTLQPEKAIDWAMQAHNTTRKGEPGGLGLKLIREFITHNEGVMIIVSDAGYWEFKNKQVITKRFESPFPGTVILIKINTANTKYYDKYDINPNDIF